MSEVNSKETTKFRERRVFLFEQIIIFSEETEKKKNSLSSPNYIFKNSLMVSLDLLSAMFHFNLNFDYIHIFHHFSHIICYNEYSGGHVFG